MYFRFQFISTLIDNDFVGIEMLFQIAQCRMCIKSTTFVIVCPVLKPHNWIYLSELNYLNISNKFCPSLSSPMLTLG